MAVENSENSFMVVRRIGEVSQDGVFIFNQSAAKFTYISPVLVKILEIQHSLLVEDPKMVLHAIPLVDQEYLRLRYAELMQRKASEDVTIRISNSKVDKILSLSAYMISEESIVGFVRNITREKEHEDYLINFGARKDTLLDMVSQNLSMPLNLSNFTMDLVERAVHEKKYHKLNSHIKLIREVTSDCIRIIDSFLQEEHLASPNIFPKVNRFDIVAKTMVVLERLRVTNPGKQFRMTTSTKHLVIGGDDVKYFQIIHNLLSNAIKFTRSNGVIEVSIVERNDHVEIEVKDDGIGIPDRLRPFLFEKKSRAGRPGLKGEVSNGIGLFVVGELVSLMKGRISVESQENKGTIFTLELPKSMP